MSMEDEEIDALGVDVTVGVSQVAHSLTLDLDYDQMIAFFGRVSEHYADTEFDRRVKAWAESL